MTNCSTTLPSTRGRAYTSQRFVQKTNFACFVVSFSNWNSSLRLVSRFSSLQFWFKYRFMIFYVVRAGAYTSINIYWKTNQFELVFMIFHFQTFGTFVYFFLVSVNFWTHSIVRIQYCGVLCVAYPQEYFCVWSYKSQLVLK